MEPESFDCRDVVVHAEMRVWLTCFQCAHGAQLYFYPTRLHNNLMQLNLAGAAVVACMIHVPAAGIESSSGEFHVQPSAVLKTRFDGPDSPDTTRSTLQIHGLGFRVQGLGFRSTLQQNATRQSLCNLNMPRPEVSERLD